MSHASYPNHLGALCEVCAQDEARRVREEAEAVRREHRTILGRHYTDLFWRCIRFIFPFLPNHPL